MTRTVKVGLDVNEQPFVRGMDRAAGAAGRLEDALDDVTDSAKDTAAGTDRASDSADDLGDSARDAAKDLDRLRTDAARLDQQIDETARGIRDLAREIARTSDEAARADLNKKLTVERGRLREQVDLRKLIDFTDADGLGAELAEKVSLSFTQRIGPLIARAPLAPAGAIAGGVLAAGLAPTLGAAVAGAVAGGVAGGGVIGGVVLAARDPAVKAAGTALGEFILADLEQRASGFTPVVLDAIDDIRDGWRSLGPDLDRIFRANRFVDPLVAGGISGARKMVAGIADVMDNADPAVDALAAGFERIGDAAGDTLSTLAEDADEGASAIDDLTMAVSNLIRVTGGIVHGAAQVKGFFDEVDQGIDRGRFALEDWMSSGGALENFGIQLDLTADGFAAGSEAAEAYRKATLGTAEAADFATLKTAGMTDAEIAAADASGRFRIQTEQAAKGVRDVGDAAAEAAPEVQTFTQFLNESLGRAAESEEATIRMGSAFLRLKDAAKDGADKGINPLTEAGNRNREALKAAADAANANAAQILKTTGNHQLAAQVTEDARKRFLAAADAMGVESGEARTLANQLFGIPKNVKSTVNADTGPARRAVQSYDAWLASVNLDKTSTIYQRVITEQNTARGGPREFNRWGGVYEHAAEGVLREAQIAAPVSPARYAWAEPETGGEAFIPRIGDRGRSLDILDQAASWYGMGITNRTATRHSGVTSTVVQQNQYTLNLTPGVVGSRYELEQWLVGALDSLQRRGRT
ncbi:hypothetical protein ACIBJE_02045 [Micromonospora sp. NPDC050187]|uniref:hypothetical protein n=1 Tax=Micromonospora sp. NPDC050187 TaxID=3364277 RepID=UPI00378FB05A